MEPAIVFPKPEQAGVIADMAATSFRATYDWYNPPARMDAYVQNNLQPHHFTRAIEDPECLLLTACFGDNIAGYAQLTPGRTPPEISLLPTLELARFYVSKGWHGKGVAGALMQGMLAKCKERGLASVWLGVWTQNPRAIAFYRKWQFEEVGNIVFQFEEDAQTDVLMMHTIKH